MLIESIIDANWAYSFALSIMLSLGKGLIMLLSLYIIEKSLFSKSAQTKYYLYFTGLCFLFTMFLFDIFKYAFSSAPHNYLPIEQLENLFGNISNFVLHVPESNPMLFQIISILWIIGVLISVIKFNLETQYLSRIRRHTEGLSEEWQNMVNQLKKPNRYSARSWCVWLSIYRCPNDNWCAKTHHYHSISIFSAF